MEVTTALQSEQHVKQELAKKLGQLQEQLGKLKDTVTPAPAEEARGTGTRLEGGRLGRDRRLGLGVGEGRHLAPGSLPRLPVAQAPCRALLSDFTKRVALGAEGHRPGWRPRAPRRRARDGVPWAASRIQPWMLPPAPLVTVPFPCLSLGVLSLRGR